MVITSGRTRWSRKQGIAVLVLLFLCTARTARAGEPSATGWDSDTSPHFLMHGADLEALEAAGRATKEYINGVVFYYVVPHPSFPDRRAYFLPLAEYVGQGRGKDVWALANVVRDPDVRVEYRDRPVQVPVERVVEQRVEVPVDRSVEVPVAVTHTIEVEKPVPVPVEVTRWETRVEPRTNWAIVIALALLAALVAGGIAAAIAVERGRREGTRAGYERGYQSGESRGRGWSSAELQEARRREHAATEALTKAHAQKTSSSDARLAAARSAAEAIRSRTGGQA